MSCWIAIATVAVLVLLAMPEGTTRTLGWPLTVAALTAGAVAVHVSRPHAPLGESGFWAVLATSAYTVLPLAVATAIGAEFTPLNDARLFAIQPEPNVIARVGWYHVLYLGALSAGYLAGRDYAAAPQAVPTPPIGQATAVTLLFLFVVSVITVALLRPDDPESGYASRYLAVQQLPLVARQALKLADGVRLVLGLAVLIWAFGDWPRRRAGVVVALLILLAITVTEAGERTTLAVAFVGCLVLRHRYVRPVRGWQFALIGLAGLLAFTALGLYRGFVGLEDRAAFQLVPGAGEFEGVFANALELMMLRDWGGLPPVPGSLLVADLVGPIPSQLLPFNKWDAADWYVTTFYPAMKDAGGGLAFGVVSQAMVGFGAPELVVRGLGMGLLFTAVDRWAGHPSRRGRLWPVIAQLWVLIFAYQTFRATSLTPFSGFLQQVPVAFVLVVATKHLLVRAAGRARP